MASHEAIIKQGGNMDMEERKDERKIVLVTGANQGLGLSIIRRTALLEPNSLYILCSRSLEKGISARAELQSQGIVAEIEVVKLDVCDDDDVVSLISLVEMKHGKLDVLINNAGISPLVHPPPSNTPSSLRTAYSTLLNTNLISPYVITKSLLPLLRKAKEPKVVFVTSGLASLEFNLKSAFVRGRRSVEYGSCKTGVNGVCVLMQGGENDFWGVDWRGRVWGEGGEEDGEGEKGGVVDGEGNEGVRGKEGYVRFFTVQPGILKTNFTGFRDGLKSPDDGAEVVVRLIVDGQGGKYYLGGTYWKCDFDEMEEVPW